MQSSCADDVLIGVALVLATIVAAVTWRTPDTVSILMAIYAIEYEATAGAVGADADVP